MNQAFPSSCVVGVLALAGCPEPAPLISSSETILHSDDTASFPSVPLNLAGDDATADTGGPRSKEDESSAPAPDPGDESSTTDLDMRSELGASDDRDTGNDTDLAQSQQDLGTSEEDIGHATEADTSGASTGSAESPPLSLSMQARPASGKAPLHVSFDGHLASVSEDASVTYRWTFGDGEESSESAPSHRYIYEGDYTVTLQVSSPEWGVLTATSSVSIEASNEAPVADAGATRVPYTSGSSPTVLLDASRSYDQDGTIVSYTWGTHCFCADETYHYGVSSAESTQEYRLRGTSDHLALRVTDNDGATATTYLELEIPRNTIQLYVDSASYELEYVGNLPGVERCEWHIDSDDAEVLPDLSDAGCVIAGGISEGWRGHAYSVFMDAHLTTGDVVRSNVLELRL